MTINSDEENLELKEHPSPLTQNLEIISKSSKMNEGIDKNIGVEPPNDGSIALFIGYIIIGVVVTFGLLSVGMCALYCRR